MLNKKKKSAYDKNYQKEHMKQISVWINKDKDADLLLWLSLQEGVSEPEYIRQCLRKQMKETLETNSEQKARFDSARATQNHSQIS